MPMAQQSPPIPPLQRPTSSSHLFFILANPRRYFSSPFQKGNKLMDNLSSYEHRSVLEPTPSANCHSMTEFSTQALARESHAKSLRWFVVALLILFLISGGWGAVIAFKYAQASLGNWRQQLQARDASSNPLAGDLPSVKKDFYGPLTRLKIVGVTPVSPVPPAG